VDEAIRVVVIDDHRMFTEAIELLLASEPGIVVAGTAHSARDGMELCLRTAPDVVLMDFDLPDLDGASAIRWLSARIPTARYLAMTALPVDRVRTRIQAAGARGVVPKSRTVEELVAAIRAVAALPPAAEVAAGVRIMRPGGGGPARSTGESRILTDRETEVLEATALGLGTAGTARALAISPLTVRTHLKSILRKLDAHSKVEAVAAAYRLGLIEPSWPGRSAVGTQVALEHPGS
jgi:DNA-binding NarL/FixJ family response regulator